ncbi:MAG: ATP-binding protein [Rickettsiales bacterium]
MSIAVTPEPRRARRGLKRVLPTGLFGRALLILLVPMVLLQLLTAYVFYERHWDSVVRNMSASAAADIAMLADEYHDLSTHLGNAEALRQTIDRGKLLAIDVRLRTDPDLAFKTSSGRQKFPDFYDMLREHVKAPLIITGVDENTVRVRVAAAQGVLDFSFSRKRLASSTTYIFILWMAGSSVLLILIASLFLRNQIRPIVQLARAAEQFGMGQEVATFAPRGANEVRRAGRAFLIMAERIKRQVTSRTDMLAGISHDLRTPLTRLMLELEMSGLTPEKLSAMRGDVDEMRRMIDEYLDFARGDSGEPFLPTELSQLLRDIASDYRRQKQPVQLQVDGPITLNVRTDGIRRALTNLIDNALRYGGGDATLSLEVSRAFVRVKVTDRGPGIPPSELENVFKPFTRLEPSRNAQTGGAGLGLAIARSIAQNHGGDITLENQYNDRGEVTGLSATLRLPREVQG